MFYSKEEADKIAAEKGFTFDKEWEEAVQKATSNAK